MLIFHVPGTLNFHVPGTLNFHVPGTLIFHAFRREIAWNRISR
jgi:hypothetical protein